jgi:hypothetical protein
VERDTAIAAQPRRADPGRRVISIVDASLDGGDDADGGDSHDAVDEDDDEAGWAAR